MTIQVRSDTASAAAALADHVTSALGAIEGPSTLGLAGGRTPRAAYAELTRRRISWAHTTMWLGDERWVAYHHPESNVGMVRAELVDKVRGHLIAPNHAIGDPRTAAAAYGTALRACFVNRGRGPAPDLVLLGMGSDGHTASLFPGTSALEESADIYTANWIEEKDAWRLTATLPLLWAAEELVFLVTGEGKATVVREVIAQGVPYPAQRAAAGARRVTWFLDEAAAAELD